MLPFLKKNSKASAQAPAWHPNFRDFTQLPDTKVVRTSFFLNGIAVLVSLAALIAFGYQEYILYMLRAQVTQSDQQIAKDKPQSDQYITLFKKFQAEERKINDVNAFVTGERLRTSDFMIRLGATLPKNISLTSVECRDTGATVRGIVRGAPDLASGTASAYEKQLQQDKDLMERFESVSLTTLSRDTQTGRLTLEMVFKLRSGKKS